MVAIPAGAPGEGTPPDGALPTGPPRPRRSRLLIALAAVAVVIFLGGVGIGAAGVIELEHYEFVRIPGVSMRDTIPDDGLVTVRKYDGSALHRGDIVVFREPSWWPGGNGSTLVKRVVAVAGDRISCCDPQGRLVVNGHSITESYIHPDPALLTIQQHAFSATVPAGTVFVEGDYRGNSMDSRFVLNSPTQGGIPLSLVTGTVVAVDTGSGPRTLPVTEAFAALGAPSAPDDGYGTGAVLLITGFGVAAVGLALLLFAGVLVFVRRARGRQNLLS